MNSCTFVKITSMNYYNDFMEIKESNYINPKHFECLGSNDIPNKISNIKAPETPGP